jgi:hypothetical protein
MQYGLPRSLPKVHGFSVGGQVIWHGQWPTTPDRVTADCALNITLVMKLGIFLAGFSVLPR